MRMIMIFLVFFYSIILFYQSTNTLVADVSSTSQLAEVYEEEGWGIDRVEVVNYVITDKQEAKNFLKNNDKDTLKLEGVIESYDVVAVTNNQVKVIYKFESNQWNEDVKKYLQNTIFNTEFRHFFKKGQIFSCFQSNIDDKISSNFIVNKISKYFDVQETNVMDEGNFTVVSGITDQFEQYIPMNKEKINIQYSVRETKSGKKTITIGTPILVIEY
ncbi:hypothetical protein E3U55_11135 [Filobacillus milosensis]|uniref:TATA-box binding n=1 Tax=Filobacillus milosensis TaxID=94137 RepID=A0A4Y8IJE3_9BACI|nr:YwmB family TATA-box binding protein [Filobacillus milosensis]TFB19258.1 hypothetical protein E3U55_11135 [Filobacillus milosensis]